jgi:hypothetical protein
MQVRQSKSAAPVTAATRHQASGKPAVANPAAQTRLPIWIQALNDRPAESLFGLQQGIQARLEISQPNDPAEQEADRVAERVMRMPDSTVQRRCSCGGLAGADGACAACRANRLGLQRGATAPALEVVPSTVQATLSTMGRPLDAATRAFIEPRFGHDFAGVRVHTDRQAAESAAAVGALAYTIGQHVVFGAGQYAPGTATGQRLLAHELAHVLQQTGSAQIGAPGFGSAVLQRQMAPNPLRFTPLAPLPLAPPPVPPPMPQRGPNPAACITPLCDRIANPPTPSTTANLQQRAEAWRTGAVDCLRAGAAASGASHAAEIITNTAQELQEEVDEINQWFTSLPLAERTRQRDEYLARLRVACARKQREAQIEFHYNVVFERGPGMPRWGTRPGEWDEIEGALDALPPSATWFNPRFLHFRREACDPDDVDPVTGSCRGRIGGEAEARPGSTDATIRIFDAGLGADPYSRSVALQLGTTFQTLRHEVGHVLMGQVSLEDRQELFERIMHWFILRRVWVERAAPPDPEFWPQQRERLRTSLGLDEAQLDTWITGLGLNSPVVQGDRTYLKRPLKPGSTDWLLHFYDTAQMPSGPEFAYARTAHEEYFAEIYALAVSRPEVLHRELPAAQVEWLKHKVFHTPEDLDALADARVEPGLRPQFVLRASRLFTWEQIQSLINMLRYEQRAAQFGGAAA